MYILNDAELFIGVIFISVAAFFAGFFAGRLPPLPPPKK